MKTKEETKAEEQEHRFYLRLADMMNKPVDMTRLIHYSDYYSGARAAMLYVIDFLERDEEPAKTKAIVLKSLMKLGVQSISAAERLLTDVTDIRISYIRDKKGKVVGAESSFVVARTNYHTLSKEEI